MLLDGRQPLRPAVWSLLSTRPIHTVWLPDTNKQFLALTLTPTATISLGQGLPGVADGFVVHIKTSDALNTQEHWSPEVILAASSPSPGPSPTGPLGQPRFHGDHIWILDPNPLSLFLLEITRIVLSSTDIVFHIVYEHEKTYNLVRA